MKDWRQRLTTTYSSSRGCRFVPPDIGQEREQHLAEVSIGFAQTNKL